MAVAASVGGFEVGVAGCTEPVAGLAGAAEPIAALTGGGGGGVESGFVVTGATDWASGEVAAATDGADDETALRGGSDVPVPNEGPGPSGAGACGGGAAAGEGGLASRHTSESAEKLRSVLRPQMGHSQPTSKRSWAASMVWAGARSRTRSRPMAKPASTRRCSSSTASSWDWHSQTLRIVDCFIRGGPTRAADPGG